MNLVKERGPKSYRDIMSNIHDFKIPPSAEDDRQPRQLSMTSLAGIELGLCDLNQIQLKPKPRRRLQDTQKDRADGLDILIQKTKAIGLRAGEEGLV
jgi:hypothetical protein